MRRIVMSVFWITLLFLWDSSTIAETIQNKESSAAVELYTLTNEELIKQAQALLNDPMARFLAELRGISGTEFLVREAMEETKAVSVPEAIPSTHEDPVKAAKAAADQAKTQLNAMKHRLELMQAEKTLMDKLIQRSESALSWAGILTDRFDKLERFLLEIRWRSEDGTLSPDKIPVELAPQRIEEQKKQLRVQENNLKEKTEDAEKELEQIVSRIEATKKAMFQTDVAYTSAKEKYSQELSRHNLEKEYSEQTPEKLLALIPELQEERIWLRGTFDKTLDRVKQAEADVLVIQQQLASLKRPEGTEILQSPVIGAETIEAATKAVEALSAYHTAQIEKLKELRPAIESHIKLSESFEGDVSVLNEHLFKMQAIGKSLEEFARKRRIKEDSIPEAMRTQALNTDRDMISGIISEVLTAAQNAKEELNHIPERIKESERSRKELAEKLVIMKKSYESAQMSRQWASGLNDITAQELVQKFHENTERFKKNKAALKKAREEFKNALKTEEDVRAKLEHLKDPFMRLAEQESLGEKQNIRKSLYEFAELELPDKATSETKKMADKTDPGESELKVEEYQDLLAGRSRVIQGEEEGRVELSEALKGLDQQIGNYVNLLTNASQSVQQRYAIASELKKRLGRGELTTGELPDGVRDALKQEIINELDTEMNDIMNQQSRISRQIEDLGRKDQNLENARKLFADILGLVGKRLDILRDQKKLEQTFERKLSDLSETERKAIEQAAIRRSETEDTLKEFFFSFVPSDRAKSLTQLLHAYYLELTEQERKAENLNQRKEMNERLIKFAEEEKAAISELIPLLQNQMKELELRKEDKSARIRARLVPQKAEDILRTYETKTGIRLSVPEPILEEKRAESIEEATETLFGLHFRIADLKKWVRLFEQRLTDSGINAEIGEYNDRQGNLNAKAASIQRQIQQLSGQPSEELAKRPKDEKPRTERERNRFLEGEIGVLRADRYKVRSQTAILVISKLVAIFILTIILTWMINFFMGRLIRRDEKGGQLAAVFSLLRTFSKLALWIFAAIAALNALGFDVGAILAGLGIGGLAIAMAAKDTLADMLGGIMIFINKPFKVGDLIKIQGHEPAFVREIGVQNTRLEDYFYGTVHTVPNSVFSVSIVENISGWPGKLWYHKIKLSRKTDTKQLELAIKVMKEAIMSHKEADFPEVRFSGFDDFAYLLEYWFNVKNFDAQHRVRTEINVEIYKRLEANNIEIAYLPVSLSPSLSPGPDPEGAV